MARDHTSEELGARPLGGGRVAFRVWAPDAESVAVELAGADRPLTRGDGGVWSAELEAAPGDLYRFVLDGDRRLPDPFSRAQPEGIRGPSQIVDTAAFEIAPKVGLRLDGLVVYELHVGTFTDEGTFDAAIPRLRALRELGITAVELLPVATFPGNRGWGYDGVYIWAPHPAYGGAEGLARLVDAAHREGLGVIMDVVYNHIGPGGDQISAFGPYFTDKHHTGWGDAIDYAQPAVREWAIGNALMWTRDYGIDGLRLDAVHAIVDDSPVHVLRELKERVDGLVISEMGPDDFRPLDEWGHDAMWLDNLHHELHVLLTDEHEGYYEDYGSMEGLVRELTRPRPERLVVAAQNHDQVGNRAVGDRLPPDAHRVALAVCLFSTCTPLLLMGEEYDESAPFQFFTDHIDPFIADATREGRKKEFEKFEAFSDEHVPDPQAEETFTRSKLRPRPADPFYARLIELHRTLPRDLAVETEGRRLTMRRGDATLVADFDAKTVELTA